MNYSQQPPFEGGGKIQKKTHPNHRACSGTKKQCNIVSVSACRAKSPELSYLRLWCRQFSLSWLWRRQQSPICSTLPGSPSCLWSVPKRAWVARYIWEIHFGKSFEIYGARIVKQRGSCNEFLLSVLPSSSESPASLLLPLHLKKRAPKSAFFTTASPFLLLSKEVLQQTKNVSAARWQKAPGVAADRLFSGCSPSLQIQGQSCLYLKLVLTNAIFKHPRGSLNKHAGWIRVNSLWHLQEPACRDAQSKGCVVCSWSAWNCHRNTRSEEFQKEENRQTLQLFSNYFQPLGFPVWLERCYNRLPQC